MKQFAGRVAAITGAASGIGRALAVDLARRGCHLALADVDPVGLAETVTLCEGAGGGVKVTSVHLDVGDRPAVLAWADQVVTDHGAVHLVFNNAGVALGATVAGMTHEDLEWLFATNFWGVVHGTQAFLPHLLAAGEGHIVNMSSVFGLVPVPAQSAYSAAKFAVRAYTDALRMELDITRAGVSATTVHPGGIRTNIARNARMDPSITEMGGDPDRVRNEFHRIARTTPERAATVILRAVARNRRRVLVGADAKAIDLAARMPATLYQRVVVTGARLGRRRHRRRSA